jgi:hypothetical protein
VEKFCTQALWIHEGRINASGIPSKVVDAYLAYMNERHYERTVAQEHKKTSGTSDEQDEGAKTENADFNDEKAGGTVDPAAKDAESVSDANEAGSESGGGAGNADERIDYNANRFGLRHIEITKAEMLSADGISRKIFKADEPITVLIHYKRNKPIDGYVFGFSFVTLEGVIVTGTNTQLDRLKIPSVGQQGKISLSFGYAPLLTGKYILQIAVVDENGLPMDYYRDYMHFEIVSRDRSVGLVSVPHSWGIS